MFPSLRWLPLAALVALGAAACGDGSTGPSGTDFDPQNAAAATSDLQAQLDEDSDIMVSLDLIGPALAAEGAVSMVLPRQLDGPVAPMAAEVARGYMLSGSVAEPIFPSNLLGMTFEWSFDLGRYALSARSGAPANGVRFILYAVNPLTRQPAEPLTEIGFLDLTDESDATATRLGVYAESAGTALVDYFIEASYALVGEDISVTLNADGYVSDGTERLDFLLAQTATLSNTTETIGLDVLYRLSLAGQDVSVTLDIAGEFSFATEGPEVVSSTLLIESGSDRVEIVVDLAADNTLDGVINYNGAPALFIGGTEADPVFERADGEPLTEADVAALMDLYDLLGDVFDVAEHLFEPFDSGF